MLDGFTGLHLAYNNLTESTAEDFSVAEMTELMMMIKTRPASYPSNKLTFTIQNIAKHKEIRFLNINLVMKGHFDVDLILEDSQRNFLNSR